MTVAVGQEASSLALLGRDRGYVLLPWGRSLRAVFLLNATALHLTRV
jgi:hypothetical protein